MTESAKRLRVLIAPFFGLFILPPIALAVVLTGCQVWRSINETAPVVCAGMAAAPR
jgi:hypothetical protein